MSQNKRSNPMPDSRADAGLRRSFVLLCLAVMGIGLIARAAYLQVFNDDYYRDQGEQRQVRKVSIPAHRGDILDRHGKPLAISTPIPSLAGVPDRLLAQIDKLHDAAEILDLDTEDFLETIQSAERRGKVFVYLKRHVLPEEAAEVERLGIEGLNVQTEYRRFYPSAGVTAHILGFTDIDDKGREGMELVYDDWLAGKAGERRVIRDRRGHVIADSQVIERATPGRDLRLSVDRQLQYFANRALQDAINTHRAESGSVVVMDVKSGEVLAMTNFPSYNPNDISDRSGEDGRQRNRAVIDVFEPGSTLKPFTVIAALESGEFKTEDLVYTSPGKLQIGEREISDLKDYGWLDMRGVVVKSSNVGISKIALQLDKTQMWSVFDAFGFGRPPGSEFPGEVAGLFNHPRNWHRYEQASVSFGYAISVTALQLVRAYAVIANDGIMPGVSFLALDEEVPGHRVIDSDIARKVSSMLESVVTSGSGKRASVPGYRVAGKTGTSHRPVRGGYAEDRYISLFAGFAPASDPQVAIAVVIHDPTAGEHFGGVVAAPVFSEVMTHALRIKGVDPDKLPDKRAAIELPAVLLDNGDRS